ncbi:hypothetical protein BGW42_000424 [Actinomortierella wolfii]|nr:hypothetical protein BGW42_000424 [Actinomortierella wolfii]
MHNAGGSSTAPLSSPVKHEVVDNVGLNSEEAAVLRLRSNTYPLKHEVEHVSFEAFVKTFELTKLESAQKHYEVLIASSQIKAWRRRSLHAEYEIFKEHHLRRFWLNHKLDMEECKERATLGITLTKTAMIIQGGSVNAAPKDAKTLAKVAEDRKIKKECHSVGADNNL